MERFFPPSLSWCLITDQKEIFSLSYLGAADIGRGLACLFVHIKDEGILFSHLWLYRPIRHQWLSFGIAQRSFSANDMCLFKCTDLGRVTTKKVIWVSHDRKEVQLLKKKKNDITDITFSWNCSNKTHQPEIKTHQIKAEVQV